MIQGPGERNHGTSTDASVGRLQTDNSAKRGGLADRARGICTNGCITQTGGNRGGGTSGRAAGNVLPIPGIADCAEVTHDRTATVSEFVQVMLA